MAIKLWWDTNITLTNTSFSCSTWWWDPAMIVSLFTVASAWNYHFEWNFTGNSVMTVALSINGANKEIWIVIWTQNWTYDFTAEVWDVITLEASGSGSGSNLSVVRYADEIKEIYVWEWNLVNDYSAMQWPCPEGFHIPTNTEWTGVRDIMSWLGFSTGNARATNLHLPLAKHIKQADWTIDSADNKGYYFASTPWTWTAMYRLYMTTSSVSSTGTGGRASWYSIRAFKDEFVKPTSSWSVINWTLWGAGIFRDQTDWIISLTSDWITGYTLEDKNLWATTVYNYWDTLSETNCWYFYQRWNNYWFPRTWPTTTSSVAIDTTGYWPWNYYNNGTFITISWDWSSPANDNLRWWITWVQQKQVWNVTEVYVGTTKVRPLTN